MKAMVLEEIGSPLQFQSLPDPVPQGREVLIRVNACAVCRTDLHVVDGELPRARLPLIPGHEIVGTVAGTGADTSRFSVGDKVGVPWLAGACGQCGYCLDNRENLCESAEFTGYNTDGGFAEYCKADERFIFPVPADCSDLQAAPLLCAGLIGYRALQAAGKGRDVGFYGFGAAAHILIQVARFRGHRVFAFTRPGDEKTQEFACSLGAEWAGGSHSPPPARLDSAIIFAPAGELVPLALRALRPGGVVVCAGIYMSDIPSFPYRLLWQERTLKSVANLTRKDGEEFMKIAADIPVKTQVSEYALEDANAALSDLKNGRVRGAAVLAVNR